jgi:hypothetical protein
MAAFNKPKKPTVVVNVGDVVKVYGHKVTVKSVHRNGKTAFVTGDNYTGYRKVSDMVAVAA